MAIVLGVWAGKKRRGKGSQRTRKEHLESTSEEAVESLTHKGGSGGEEEIEGEGGGGEGLSKEKRKIPESRWHQRVSLGEGSEKKKTIVKGGQGLENRKRKGSKPCVLKKA